MTIPLEHRGYVYAGWLLWLLLFGVSVVVTALWGQWAYLAVFGGFAVGSALAWQLQPWLPSAFWPFVVVSVFLDAAGWGFEWYFEFGPYDSIAHGLTCFTIAVGIAYLIRRSRRMVFPRHKWLFCLTVVSMALAAGAFWEVLEWMFGAVETRANSISDLLSDTVGAILGGLLSMRQEGDTIHLWSEPAGKPERASQWLAERR